MKRETLLTGALLNMANAARLTEGDIHRPAWHLSPPAGLLNDPNGFIHFNGRYHLFYQWNPLACAHGAKWWGHWSSDNLIHWKNEPIALLPDQPYDSHGCYSGSAVNDDGKLVLIYTGNVKFPGGRTAWQCLANVDADGKVEKRGPVLGLPEGYTGHVRDPKVWKHQERWYMVLGAQNLKLEGKVLLYCGESLDQWRLVGEIAGSHLNGLGDFGYMWECPDMFALGAREVLITCPQGLPAGEKYWLNTYQSGYFIGSLDYDNGAFTHNAFTELDLGFEFYAPQTMETDDGRRILIAWMGIPDENEFYQPTIKHGWIHTLTCPRELKIEKGKLYQSPVAELQHLRGQLVSQSGPAQSLEPLAIQQAELLIRAEGEWQAHFGQALTLKCSHEGLELTRTHLRTGEPESRYWLGEVQQLQILCDRSSVEIFINQGEAVMSSRYFPDRAAVLTWQGEGKVHVDCWQLKNAMIV